jgi:PAS domain S-box-containing protein
MYQKSKEVESAPETSYLVKISEESPDERFKLLFDTMKQGIVHQALDGRIILANQAAEEILGVKFDQMKERTSENAEWSAVREDETPLPGEEHPSMVALKTGENVLDFIMGVHNPRKDQRIWIKVDAIPLFKEGEQDPYEVYTVFDDITSKKNLEEDLKDSEERYRSLFEAAGDAIMITRITPEGPKFEACNDKANELFGVERGKLCGMDPMVISPPLQPDGEPSGSTIMKNIQKVMKGETVQVEWVHRRMDGSDFPCEVTLSAIHSQRGPLVQAIVRDITERKSAEDSVRRSEEKYRNLVETIPEGISTTDLMGNMTSVNPANLEMLGYENEEELLGRSSLDLIVEKQRETALKGFEETVINEKIGSRRYDLIRKDGSTFPAELIASIVRNNDGKPESFIAVTRDISDKIKSEEALMESEEKYRGLIDNISDAVFEIDMDSNFIYASPQVNEIFGFAPEEIIGENFLNFIHPDDLQKSMDVFNYMVNEKKVTNFELRSRHKDGHYIHINSSGRLVEKKDGSRSVVVVLRDVTEKIITSQQIESEKNRAEFYLDLLSHDIGNIHQGLQAWTYIARSSSNDQEKMDKALSKIEELENRSLRLVKNVLMLSRLKDLKTNFKAIDIAQLVGNAIDDISNMFGERTVDVSFQKPDESVLVMAEPVIEEVFFNLLHNGVKFQYEDPVKLKVTMETSDTEVAIDFIDHGIGIPNEQKGYIFDRHRKGSDHGYSGIGLSLVKELVSRYHGRIEVGDRINGESRKGARFRIFLLLADK